ncbi:PadR family transcriptional regulator, regulatory protein PadR [Clostridium cavendishii DSM 21758]|uniref:PadR family transcriptional regulator, regulatory protein PadR n=1 Tax=Clostridium cavendishii DSM 21758 TaxID=1121302 RepID=A0A1M6EEC3_9CLOT|nr:PadR family transcriptional regulator [Clostridium cavendishii]SHI83771.1 PadR family transcriptional regulator, regulatory protein PadR [Clostridium cavendishii DSM 21758]
MEINKEQLKGYIESIILNCISTQDRYGYEIMKKIKESSNDTFEMKEGTLYVVLKRLEVKGLVTSYWNDDTNGGRRKYYNITEEGKEQLNIKKSEWSFFKEVIDKLMV